MATTHPMIIKVVAKHLLNHGCKVIVGDSRGGTYTKVALKSLYKICGIESVCEELNIELNYDILEVKVNNLNGKLGVQNAQYHFKMPKVVDFTDALVY